MTVLEVDQPTTTAYAEVGALSHTMAGHVAGIVSASDSLGTAAQGLENETRNAHGRMADANRTHTVQMANPEFIKRR